MQHVEPYYNAPSYDAGQVKSFNPKKKVLSKEVESIFMERDDEYEYEETEGA